VLKLSLRAAVRDRVLATMPDVTTPQRKSVRHDQDHAPEDDVATPAQVEALHEAIPQPWSIAVLLAAWCQLRRGEVLGLQRRDIVWNTDSTAATLHERLQKNGSTGTLTDPMSEMGVRSMAVPPLMIACLREQIDEHVGAAPSSLVVPTRVKGSVHMAASRWNANWSEHRVAVDGLLHGYRFHDLRHAGLTRFA
jgi:integrase